MTARFLSAILPCLLAGLLFFATMPLLAGDPPPDPTPTSAPGPDPEPTPEPCHDKFGNEVPCPEEDPEPAPEPEPEPEPTPEEPTPTPPTPTPTHEPCHDSEGNEIPCQYPEEPTPVPSPTPDLPPTPEPTSPDSGHCYNSAGEVVSCDATPTPVPPPTEPPPPDPSPTPDDDPPPGGDGPPPPTDSQTIDCAGSDVTFTIEIQKEPDDPICAGSIVWGQDGFAAIRSDPLEAYLLVTNIVTEPLSNERLCDVGEQVISWKGEMECGTDENGNAIFVDIYLSLEVVFEDCCDQAQCQEFDTELCSCVEDCTDCQRPEPVTCHVEDEDGCGYVFDPCALWGGPFNPGQVGGIVCCGGTMHVCVEEGAHGDCKSNPDSPACREIYDCTRAHEQAEVNCGLGECPDHDGKDTGIAGPSGDTDEDREQNEACSDCAGLTAQIDCLNNKLNDLSNICPNQVEDPAGFQECLNALLKELGNAENYRSRKCKRCCDAMNCDKPCPN